MAEEKKTSEQAKAEKKADAKTKKPVKKNKKNPFKSIVTFFKSVKAEGKKVVWAKGKEVVKNTIIVLIVVFIAGLAIFVVDTALTQGMGAIKNLKPTTTAASVEQNENALADAIADAQDEADTNADADAAAQAEDGAETAE